MEEVCILRSPGIAASLISFFVHGRSLWAELNGGENSLHLKANMLPLFSIMTLWFKTPPKFPRNSGFIRIIVTFNVRTESWIQMIALYCEIFSCLF